MHRTIHVYCRTGGPRRPVWFLSERARAVGSSSTLGTFGAALVCRRLGFDRRCTTVHFHIT